MIRRVLLGCLFALAASACAQNGTAHGGEGGAAGDTTGAAGEGGPSAGTGGTQATGGAAGDPAGSGGAGGKPSTGVAGSGVAGAPGGIAGGPSTGVAGSGGIAGKPTTGVAGSGGVAGSSPVGGTGGRKPPTPVKNLPIIKEMPDPLTMNDGTKVTTVEQWKLRRKEMIQLLEDYEYGHAPPPPGNVKATTVTASRRVSAGTGLEADYRMLHLTFGPGEKLGFDLGIFTPVTSSQPAAKFPILISLGTAATDKSLGSASAALARGYAVATVPYQQLGADASNWASTAFFPAYPDYDWRDFAAWAWGLSRAVDYLVTDASIDPSKIMVTGVSRTGQAALLVGALDERIALTAPVAGGAAFRFSGKEMGGGLGQGITEIVDQNTYWFGPRLPEFRNQTPRLPSDQHWLPALTAPRLFIMTNSLMDQYGRAYAAVQTYLAAKPVYAFLDADDNIGVHFRQGSHGITAEDWSAILDFADQYLLKKGGTRKFDLLPPADQLP